MIRGSSIGLDRRRIIALVTSTLSRISFLVYLFTQPSSAANNYREILVAAAARYYFDNFSDDYWSSLFYVVIADKG